MWWCGSARLGRDQGHSPYALQPGARCPAPGICCPVHICLENIRRDFSLQLIPNHFSRWWQSPDDKNMRAASSNLTHDPEPLLVTRCFGLMRELIQGEGLQRRPHCPFAPRLPTTMYSSWGFKSWPCTRTGARTIALTWVGHLLSPSISHAFGGCARSVARSKPPH